MMNPVSNLVRNTSLSNCICVSGSRIVKNVLHVITLMSISFAAFDGASNNSNYDVMVQFLVLVYIWYGGTAWEKLQ